MILSLRTRLLWGIILGTAALLTVFSVMVYVITERKMIQNFDTSLMSTARMLSAVIEEEDADVKADRREVDFEFDVRMIPEFNNVNGGAYYQIWSSDGKILVRSPSLGEQNLDCFKSVLNTPQYRETILPDQIRGRAISYSFLPRVGDESIQSTLSPEPMLTLVLAQRADVVYDHLDFLKWLLAAASMGVVFLSAGVAFLVTRTSLGPVHSLAEAITSVREDNLGLTFALERYPTELTPICQCLNDTFRRLQASFQREKQFNADVAHELRTPLAGMQSIIEVCLSRPRESVEYQHAFEDCLQVVRAMNKMIDTLLILSRLDAGQISIQNESVNLNILIDETWQFFADTAHDRNISFDNTVGADVVCQSDRTHLGMILSNILHNAAEYTNPGGRIWTTAELSDGAMTVLVHNTGCELIEDDVAHIFDFFWRKSSSRTDTDRHCGIGLSVARKVATVLGIEMTINVNNNVFSVHLHFKN